jgi:ferredoxin
MSTMKMPKSRKNYALRFYWRMVLSLVWLESSLAFSPVVQRHISGLSPFSWRVLWMNDDPWGENNHMDSNQWKSSNDISDGRQGDQEVDWQDLIRAKEDGSFWSSFEPSSSDENNDNSKRTPMFDEDYATEQWLDTVQSLSAEEVQFNLKEADRADKVRQMIEWGFEKETIQNTLGVAMDSSLEIVGGEMEGMQKYREETYEEEVDLSTVESHTRVEVDEETGEPLRSQMVYVDEHTCIGCTNCATIAQSTFFMNSEHGRARVYEQWGDDDETIQIAIDTCPVNCIHYVSRDITVFNLNFTMLFLTSFCTYLSIAFQVPYEELVRLEIERRDQNINFKARLVSQAEYGNTLSHLTGRGSNAFTAPQIISGNMGARCSNCPSRGCKNCPMYGVGQNPEFERKEKARKERLAKRKLKQQREREEKSVEL